PVDDILALPDLLTEDLERGGDFLTGEVQARPPRRRPVIHIPAWDEIVHIVPEAFLPAEEQARRRQERAIRILESPTPESVQAIGSILTWVDDVQDALVTASVLARLGSVFYKPLLPVATGLGAAAEAINLFGAAGALASTPLTGKFRAHQASKALVGGQVARALRATTLGRALPTIGETVQILQTTDQLFGVGLSLGPIVGLVEELIFGLPQGAEFAFQSGIRYRPGDEVFLREEDQNAAEALSLLARLRSIAAGGPAAAWVLAAPAGPTYSDRVDALILLSLLAELARGFLTESRWKPIVLPQLDRERAPAGQLRPAAALDLRRRGVDPEATKTFPVPGNPTRLSPRRQAEELLRQGPAALPGWLQEASSLPARLFTEQLAADLPFRVVRAIEGCPCDFEIHGSPEWRAVIDSLELGLVPPTPANNTLTRRYVESAATLYQEDPGRPIPARELQELHVAIFSPART
ncbi:MAG: hypothetical protein ACE5JN_16390, partial [Candidatus Methylomirabilia bacterium]